MKFLDRQAEITRLDRLMKRHDAGLAVVSGRRRIGKTTMLLEWNARHHGLYWVGDESTSAIQRKQLAETLGQIFPGFGDVEYPNWGTLFGRLGREAVRSGWRGPLILDEVPYLVVAAPELPSVLQRFIDHDAKKARLVLVLAGSSQQMMQDFVLASAAPLFGRAHEIMVLSPLPVGYIGQALGLRNARQMLEAYTLWGGVPRYWELARDFGSELFAAAEALVLDPRGILANEPQHLLLEEIPSAAALRPVLDAIGMGTQRLSEIASRVAQPVTSLSRPLARLQQLGFVKREAPFGSDEKTGKRALYKIIDPFLRLWFQIVAPRRATMVQALPTHRIRLLKDAWPRLCAQTWEDLCRDAVPHIGAVFNQSAFLPACRFWHGKGPEWDVVSRTASPQTWLIGEAKWTEKDPTVKFIEQAVANLRAKGLPPLPRENLASVCFVLFVPKLPKQKLTLPFDTYVMDASTVLAIRE